MDYQPDNHGDGVETQFLPHRRGVVHLQDLASHQEDDPKWKIPAG